MRDGFSQGACRLFLTLAHWAAAVVLLVGGMTAPAHAYLRKVANVTYVASEARTGPPYYFFATFTEAAEFNCRFIGGPSFVAAWPEWLDESEAGIRASPFFLQNTVVHHCTQANGNLGFLALSGLSINTRPSCDAPWFRADPDNRVTECRLICPPGTTEYQSDGTVNVFPHSANGESCRDATGRAVFGRTAAGGVASTKLPACGRNNPCDPATGMKSQLEPVYRGTAGAFPVGYSLQYRSRRQDDPFDGWRGVNGYGWMSPFERRVKFYDPAVNPGSGSYGVKRPDGREFEFVAPAMGNVYVAEADVVDKLERLVDTGGATLGWKYTSAGGDEVETYDAGGLFLDVANRAGLRTLLTYSSGISNDTGISRYPGNAPVCSQVHPAITAGQVLAPRRLLCVTDSGGRQINFQYDQRTGTRIVAMLDPAGGLFRFDYDGVSGGCASPGSDAPACTATNLTQVAYPDGRSRRYHYNEPANINGGNACAGLTNGLLNHLTGITDENGSRFADYTYDCLGRATSTQHAGGVEKATFTFNSDGTTTVADYVGNPAVPTIVNREYSFLTTLGVSRTSGIVDPSTGQPAPCAGCGATATASYDANGNLVSRTDWNGNRTHYRYDSTSNLEVARTEGLTSAGGTTAATRTIETDWHSSYRLPTQVVEKSSSGAVLRTTTMNYDAAGNLVSRSVTSGSGRTWAYTYNTNGQVLTMDGPRTDVADVTNYTYFPDTSSCTGCRGQLQSITDPLGHTTSFTEYDAHGQPLTITDPNGLVTALVYDSRQRLTSRSVGRETTSYTYDGVGQLARGTLPDGSFLDYTYDAARRLIQIADNLGNRIAYTLDLQGNRTQEQVLDPASQLAQSRSRVYNSVNRLAQEIGAQSQTTTYAYDNQGNVTSIDGPLAGSVDLTTNGYDALNRLIRVTNAQSGQVNHAYNGLDQLVSVSDPRTLVTTYGYDGLNNLNQLVSPDTGTTTNTYDAAGNLLTQTDAKGQVTSYAYDALNRVTGITYQDGATHNYEYDQGANGLGRLTRITEPNSITQYAYDQIGRLTTETRVINAINYITAYSYDAAGRMTGVSYASGRQVTYAFDALGRVNRITTTKNGAAQTVLSNADYRPFGPLRAFTFGNGQNYIRGFDRDGRVYGYTLGSQSFVLGFDAASRITSIGDLANPASNNAYGYDSLDRLTQAVLPSTNFAYSYDAVGNRLSRTAGAATDIYSYGATSNRLESLTPATGPMRNFVFDANGSTTSDAINQFSYDARGRLVQANTGLGIMQYRVNSLGQRIRKTGNQIDTIFHYDSQGRLIAESGADGSVKAEYIYLGDIPVAVVR